MPTVKFHHEKKSGYIFASFNYQRGTKPTRLRYSCRMKCPLNVWNKRTQRIKASPTYSSAKSKNAMLNRIAQVIESIYYRYEYEDKLSKLTTPVFKQAINEALNRKKRVNLTFFEFIKQFIRDRDRTRAVADLTLVKYQNALNHMSDFAKLGNSCDFEDITVSWANDFRQYLSSIGLQQNTVAKIFKQVRVFMNAANRAELTDNTAHKLKEFAISEHEVDNIYLTSKELEKVFKVKLERETARVVRDWFLVGCFTGQRFSDWHKFRKPIISKEQGVEVLKMRSQKTRIEVAIPIDPVLRAIFERWNYELPKLYAEQTIRKEIKEICKAAGITQPTKKTVYPGGVKVVQTLPKWKRVSTHTARRSWASNAYLLGWDIIDICRIGGWKKPEQARAYIKADALQSAIKMSKNKELSGSWLKVS